MPIAKFIAALVGALTIAAFLVRPACGCTTKVPAYYAMTRADLRNLITAQETFFADSGRYARAMAEFGSEGYVSSPGVRVELAVPGDSGYRAEARHEALPEVTCSVWIGKGIEVSEDPEGEPVCRPPHKTKRWAFVWQ